MKTDKPAYSSHGPAPAGLGAGTLRADRRWGGGCGPIVVIDRCKPARSYLVKCLEEATDGAKIIAFPCVSEWLEVAQDHERPKVVLVCNSGHDDPEGSVVEDPSPLSGLTDVSVIVLPSTEAAPRGSYIGPHELQRGTGRRLRGASGEQEEAFASWYRTEVVE